MMFVYNISLFYVNLVAKLTKKFQIEAKTPDFFIKKYRRNYLDYSKLRF